MGMDINGLWTTSKTVNESTAVGNTKETNQKYSNE